MRALAKVLCLCLLSLLTPFSASAQNFPVFEDFLPVAMVNQDRLFTGSDFGKKFERDFATKRNELVAENRRIESELEQEELDLVDKRTTLEVTEFRKLATLFDKKVVGIRQAQKTKISDLNRAVETARQQFFALATPIIERYMDEHGIVFLLHEQAIFLGRQTGDITGELILRINLETETQAPNPQ